MESKKWEAEAVELCPECEGENILHFEHAWEISALGFEAKCSHCGASLMLCDECRHGEDNPSKICDWDKKTNGCFRIVEKFWDELEDLPLDEDADGQVVIAQDFNSSSRTDVRNERRFSVSFPKGTPVETIWHWFDHHHPKGVRYLLYGRFPYGTI